MPIPSTISLHQPLFVDNVPVEIWTEIIENTQHIPATDVPCAQRTLSRRSVISASQICSRLRKIVLGTPSLWTTIFVDFDSCTPFDDVLLTKLWLERAGTCPLSITLLQIPAWDEADDASYECLVTVLSQMPRWKSAYLSWMSSEPDFWPTMDSLMGPAPLLESLVLHVYPEDESIGHTLFPSKLWLDSPLLRKLVVTLPDGHAGGFARWETSYRIPYSQLTHLRLARAPNEIIARKELVSIFSSSPNLVACFVEGIASSPPSFENANRILLQHLRHLYLEPSDHGETFNDVPSISEMLDYITAPSLVTLSLVREINWDIAAYKNFITRSSCQLEELNLVETEICILTLMESSPSLRAVHIDDLIIDEPFLKNWSTWDTTENTFRIGPNLERLSVTCGNIYGDFRRFRAAASGSSSPLTQALRSRLCPPTGGSKIFSTLLISDYNDLGVSPAIRALGNEPFGLKIEFNDDRCKEGALWDLYSDR